MDKYRDRPRDNDGLVRAFVGGLLDRNRNPHFDAVSLDHYWGNQVKAWLWGWRVANVGRR